MLPHRMKMASVSNPAGSPGVYTRAGIAIRGRCGMMTVNILTLYMIMVFATWSYFLGDEEDM